uniref:Major sperm protein n=1 Tax=Caenorhabditis tropicalis TaxID=1561998 RepID=A0A1I7TZT7_9PELO
MWRSDEEKPSTSSASARPSNSKHASVTNLERSKSSTSLFKRAISLQFLVKNTDNIVDREKAAYIKMRYKDTAKYVIWPVCRLPDKIEQPVSFFLRPFFGNVNSHDKTIPIICFVQKPAPLVPVARDPRTVLMEPDLEDHKSPYMPATINHVLRSDSEDSSDAEQVLEMTRL